MSCVHVGHFHYLKGTFVFFVGCYAYFSDLLCEDMARIGEIMKVVRDCQLLFFLQRSSSPLAHVRAEGAQAADPCASMLGDRSSLDTSFAYAHMLFRSLSARQSQSASSKRRVQAA